jgi:uncharacterized Zn finger protein (UPF0148 family)
MTKRKCPHCGADLVNFCGVWICPYDCEETEELDFPEDRGYGKDA